MTLCYRAFILPLVLCWGYGLAQTDSLIHSGYHIERGKVLVDSGLYEQAIREFRFIDPRDTSYVLSLTEQANAYFANKQYDEAIATSAKALLQVSPYRSQLLITQGMAHVEKGQYDQARAIFETGLKEFPFQAGFSIQYGKMLYVQKKYVEAEKYFFQAFEISPFNLTSHLYLGFTSMLRGEKTRGMMAMGIYMSLNNSANSQLVTLERFVKNELTDEFSIPPSTPNPFARLDEIIRSKITMDDRYKTNIPINAGIVKQYQLMFDQIATQEFVGNDPWLSLYLPIYKALIKANHQEAFVYHILKSTSIKEVPEWTKKNEKTLTEFYSVMNTAIPQARVRKTLPESWGYREPVSCWYGDDNRLDAIGQENNKKERTGPWYFYHDNGCLKAKGTYDDHGKKTGLWKYNNSSGLQVNIENFDTGERIIYDDRGRMKQKYFLKNNMVEGDLFFYYPCGAVNEHIRYRQGEREGPGEVYSIYGTAIEKFTFMKDSLQGKYQAFFDTGELRRENTYERGKFDKTYTLFHQNGKIAAQGEYVKGKSTGPWKHYHDNGKVKEEGQFKEDLPVGKFTYYDRSGNVNEIRNYDEKGEIDGENLFFHNGVKHYRMTFRDHIITELVYYDQQGKVTKTFADEKGNIQGKGYYHTGELRSEFQYVGGKATGTWKYYYRTGNTESTQEYKDSELDGKSVDYYPDKTIKNISYYQDGKLHGYYEGFRENGQLRISGWYQNGKLQQQWIVYHPNGKVKSDEYYLNGELTGPASYYDPEGKIVSTTEFQDGKVMGMKYFNENGELNPEMPKSEDGYLKASIRFKSGVEALRTEVLCGSFHGKVVTYLPDGKPYLVQSFINDKRHGDYENYYPDGRLESKGKYRAGNSIGTLIWYYPNQSIETFGNYVDDERDSVWTYHYENGKVSLLASYENGKRHGTSKIFGPDGQLILEKLFDEGDLIAYRYPGPQNTPWTSFSGTGAISARYPGGQLAFEETYANGELEGARKIYFVTGGLFKIDNFSKGLSEGVSQVNFQNGKIRYKINWKMDEPSGRWEFYSVDGKLERTENYSYGQLQGAAEFFSNGKKIKEVKFWHGRPID